MATLHSVSPRSARRPASVGFNLLAMLLLAMTVTVGAAYLLDREIQRVDGPSHPATSTTMVTRTISGQTFEIPSHWLRRGAETTNAFARQVDLGLGVKLDGLAGTQSVEIVLLPRNQIRSGAAMLDTVYIHQFAEETLSRWSGLVGKALKTDNGVTGETVWYDPLAPNPFVAKCFDPIADGEPGQCLRTLVLPSGIAAVVTFKDDVLVAWRQLDAEVLRLLNAIEAS